MSLTNSSSWAYNPSTGFYNDVATQSLRIDDVGSAYASKTFSSAGNQQSWTWSCWVKRSTLGSFQHLFGAQQNGSNIGTIFFKSDDTLKVNNKTNNSNGDECRTNAKFRDTSSWYHIVVAFDGSQATQSNRSKIYVNGVLQARTTELGLSTGNGYMNTNGKEHSVGARRESGTDYKFDGYLAEMHFIDGQTLSPTSFGETKNDIWIPKAYSGSYGTNGVYLKFAGNTNDSSGNSNNFTSFNISAHDYVADCPENNWCTISSLYNGLTNSLSEGALKHANNTNAKGTATLGFSSGKFYYEHVRLSGSGDGEFGIVKLGTRIPSTNFGDDTNSVSCWLQTGAIRYNGTFPANLGAFSNGDILNIAMDVDAGKVWFGKNNTWYNSGNPASGTNATVSSLTAGTWTASMKQYRVGVFNFGQDSSFAGNKTSGSASAADDNGFGDFYYTPPSGYLALCSANMPDPDGVDPNADESPKDYFNTVTYTGTGSTQSRTGVGFQPDFLWIKQRNTARSHRLLNSSMFSYYLSSDTTNNQAPNDVVNSLDSDGFTLLSPSSVNQSGGTYVAWNWKANGGTTSSNTSGSITSTVQANQTAGFSILTYTGNGSSGATIGHGLSQAPDLIITKHRTGGSPGSGWIFPVFHHRNTFYTAATGGYFRLQDINGTTNNTETVKAVGSSTYTVGNAGHINLNSGQFVAWVFHEVEGYSSFASYLGNGSTDGAFCYTGFRPAFIIIKAYSNNDWLMYDTQRIGYNEENQYLLPNRNYAEQTDIEIDIVSNGFKIRDTSGRVNTNGTGYITIAFAEQPFKYANAR
jgi:hypothetical protein